MENYKKQCMQPFSLIEYTHIQGRLISPRNPVQTIAG